MLEGNQQKEPASKPYVARKTQVAANPQQFNSELPGASA